MILNGILRKQERILLLDLQSETVVSLFPGSDAMEELQAITGEVNWLITEEFSDNAAPKA